MKKLGPKTSINRTIPITDKKKIAESKTEEAVVVAQEVQEQIQLPAGPNESELSF